MQKGATRTLASHIDTIYFVENSSKKLKKFTEKGVAVVHSANP